MRGRLAAAAVLTLGCGAAVFAQAGSKAAIEKIEKAGGSVKLPEQAAAE